MDQLIFLKKRLGNTISRPFGLFSIVLGVGFISSGISVIGVIIMTIFILAGLLYCFGKEMAEINFTEQYINQYYQILFLKLKNKKNLPEIAYLLVRDFHSKEDFSTMSDDISYYEISFVTTQEKKIVLALYQRRKKVNSLIDKFRKFDFLTIKDNTRLKILKEN